jgi:glucans biosynthesis protein C
MTQTAPLHHRLSYFDNIRALMIIFVVLMHTAVTYSGFGGWYYKEEMSNDMFSSLLFALFQTYLQAFFMSLLFMIAGYFSALSIEKKTSSQFIKGRLLRLGIPTLFYMVIVHPICIKVLNPDLELGTFIVNGLKSGKILSWSGPLWFTLTLLIYSLVYLAKRKWLPKLTFSNFEFTPKNVLAITGIVTLIAFLVRLVFPIGSSVLNLQFSFFTAYIVFYVLGIISYQNKSLDSLDSAGNKFLLFSIISGLIFWFAIMIFGGPVSGEFYIEGGWHWQAFAFALWESFTCVLFCIGIFKIFKKTFNSQNKAQKFLSDHAFGVYVFHAPILISISLVLKNLTMYPLLKFGLVAAITIPACFIFSWLIKKIPIFKKVFS